MTITDTRPVPSTVVTSNTRPHLVVTIDIDENGQYEGQCVNCGEWGERDALLYPLPNEYGCTAR